VPTVSGIAPAPVGAPTVYVIETPTPARRKTTVRSRAQAPVHPRARANTFVQAPVAAPTFAPDGPRIISVHVPPRQASLK
jgi:hypothetical protein